MTTTIDLDKQPDYDKLQARADRDNLLILTLCPDTFAALHRLTVAIEQGTIAIHQLQELYATGEVTDASAVSRGLLHGNIDMGEPDTVAEQAEMMRDHVPDMSDPDERPVCNPTVPLPDFLQSDYNATRSAESFFGDEQQAKQGKSPIQEALDTAEITRITERFLRDSFIREGYDALHHP